MDESLVIDDADELFRVMLEDGLATQNRFPVEPVLATTGEGLLKSAGVEGLLADARRIDVYKERTGGG